MICTVHKYWGISIHFIALSIRSVNKQVHQYTFDRRGRERFTKIGIETHICDTISSFSFWNKIQERQKYFQVVCLR